MVSPQPERRDRIEAVGLSMPELVELLSNEVARDVVDKTGFRETFDFTLEFAPEEAVGVANSSSLTIFAALQGQLGLRLQSAKGPVEVLVMTTWTNLLLISTSGRPTSYPLLRNEHATRCVSAAAVA